MLKAIFDSLVFYRKKTIQRRLQRFIDHFTDIEKLCTTEKNKDYWGGFTDALKMINNNFN